MENNKIPKDWLQGLKENWKADALSGFIVSLLALPLSIGIANASDFPNPIFGILTAIVGGLIVSLISGSKLTIKGPAAGLIVIVAGSVAAFGGGENGWKLALGTMFVAGALQVIFGFLKLGRFSELFPHTVIHGMLGAIGLIILSKQLHILMGVNPKHHAGENIGKPLIEPIELIIEFPRTIQTLISSPDNQKMFLIGLICLIIVFTWPLIKNKFIKKIPVPLVVLAIAIPLGQYFDLKNIKGGLVNLGNIFELVDFHVSFSGISQIWIFFKFVAFFAIIGSIESLLTVSAGDMMDPYKRKSNTNKDLIAVGSGNMITSALGGLPMISEVARTTANINNGAQTRWANFFHGLSLLILVSLAVPVLNLIPNAALAALLIGVGYKLANPKELGHMLSIGWEQLVIMVSTTVVTLLTDLLIGVFVGVQVKLFIHYFMGMPVKRTFVAATKTIVEENQTYRFKILEAAVIFNFPTVKRELDKIGNNNTIYIDLSECFIVDHSSMVALYNYKRDYEEIGGDIRIVGLDKHTRVSKDKTSAQYMSRSLRKVIKDANINLRK